MISLELEANELSIEQISVVILAGGEGSRVGYQQKALLSYQGKPIIETILARLLPQTESLWVNANAELETYQQYLSDVFSDHYQGFLGPLAGMQASWEYINTQWALFIPCDNPNLPDDFVQRMAQAYHHNPAPLVVVNDGKRMQPLYLLMHRSMAPVLDAAIQKRHLSVNRWVRENEFSEADFSACCPGAFENMNTLEFYDKP